jgi:predicted PurR-regulated permease PerM
MSKALHGRQKAAGLVTTVMLLLVVAPFALAVTTLWPSAKSLVLQLRGASGGRGFLEALVSGNGITGGGGKIDVVGLAKEYGAGASKALAVIASGSAEVIVGMFIFFATMFALLVEGERSFAWLDSRVPLEPGVFKRFHDAFFQAGKGLLVGTGLTALIQGVLAGVIYAALGVPRAVLLGLLSVVGALIPVTGPAIVWVPVAAGLALTGSTGKALVLVALCVVVVGTVDNVVRPWLSEKANVGLPTTIVLVTIFGGMAAFGPWGLLLGPLAVRLGVEALEIARDRNVFGSGRRQLS